MKWVRKNRYYSESDEGYRVVATGSADDGWRFTAFSPADLRIDGYYKKTYAELEKAGFKVRYKLGERVPQPRENLGTYDTAAAAVSRCQQHLESQQHETAA